VFIREAQIREFASANAKERAAGLPSRIRDELRSKGIGAEFEPLTGDLLVKDQRGHPSRVSFKQGLPVRVSNPLGRCVSLDFTEEGNVGTVRDPSGRETHFRYGLSGRLDEITDGVRSWKLRYGSHGRIEAITFPDGLSWRVAYDPEANRVLWTDRSGGVTTFAWPADGFVDVVSDPLGRETIFQGDDFANIQAIRFADGSYELSVLDSATGRRVVTRRDKSQVVETFDPAGLPQGVEWPDGRKLTFAFDDSANSVRMNDGKRSLVIHQPPAGGVVELAESSRAQFAFDADGRVTTLSSSGTDDIQYGYDADGKPTQVVFWNREVRLSYGASGDLERIEYPNRVARLFQYHSQGGLARAETVRAGVRLSQQTYEYDVMDQLTAFADDLGQERVCQLALQYDPELRVTAETDLLQKAILCDFGYDRNGNLIRAGTAEMVQGLLDEPLHYGNQTIETDSLGRLIEFPSAEGRLRCQWAADEMLESVGHTHKDDVFAAFFSYDPLGRRVEKRSAGAEWRYGWAGFKMVWEEWRSPSGEWQRRDYAYLPEGNSPFAFLESGRIYWCEQDIRGATIRVRDEAGNVCWAAVYTSFGEARVVVDRIRQPWRLCGQYLDPETGLHYSFHRYYSSYLKSYLSRDPAWSQPGATPYSYCGNRPWLMNDPLGGILFWIKTILGMILFFFLRGILLDDIYLWGARRATQFVEDLTVVRHRTTVRRLITVGRTTFTAYTLGLPVTMVAVLGTRLVSFCAAHWIRPRRTKKGNDAPLVFRDFATWLPYVVPMGCLIFELSGSFCGFLEDNGVSTQLQCSGLGGVTAFSDIAARIGCLYTLSEGENVMWALLHYAGDWAPLGAIQGQIVGAAGYLKNMQTAVFGEPEAATGFQAQHLIPKGPEFDHHPLFQAIGFDFSSPFDLIFLPVRRGQRDYTDQLVVARLSTPHQGGHNEYSAMVKQLLNVIYQGFRIHRSPRLAQYELHLLVRALRFMQEEGTPIYHLDGVLARGRMRAMAMIWWWWAE